MARFRRLERKDEKGQWYADAYAIEDALGHVIFRYPLAWEYLGARFNAEIRQRGLTLDTLEQLIHGRNLRWSSIQIARDDYEYVMSELDLACNIPTRTKTIVGRAA